MWNPFKKKPVTFLESLTDHVMHKQPPKPSHTKRNIFLGIIFLFLLGGILFPMFKKLSQTPIAPAPMATVSSEVTPNQIQNKDDKANIDVKPGEICIKHPDIFIFSYTLSGTTDTEAIDTQMQVVQSLAQKGAIALIDDGNLKKSIKRGCFAGNPLWIFRGNSPETLSTLTPIFTAQKIPLSTHPIDLSELSSYNVQQIPIDIVTKEEFFRETLKKYLELESGGLFRDIY